MAAKLFPLPSSRRWLQFSLRTMLVLTLVSSAWLGRFVDRARRQKQAIDLILEEDGGVIYQHEVKADVDADAWLEGTRDALDLDAAPAPAWVCRSLGEEYFLRVVCASLWRHAADDVAAQRLIDLPWLEELHLRGFRGRDFSQLEGVPGLRRVFIGSNGAGIRLGHLQASRKLEVLNVQGRFSDADLEDLEQFAALRELDLSSPSLTDQTLRRIAKLPRLEYLRFSSPGITDAGVKALSTMKRLKTLKLSDPIVKSRLTDETLKHLAALPRLEYLHLQAPNITGEGLRSLNANLVKLGLTSGAPLADADIVHLTRLKKLEWVYVSQPTTLTDAGLEAFEQMHQLKTLHLRAPAPRCKAFSA